MSEFKQIGRSFSRTDGLDKVHGKQEYVNDYQPTGLLHAALKISTHAHAKIKSIDTAEAEAASGVQAVITGDDFPVTLGLYMGDHPPLALHKVRHYGEPVAAVIANTEHQAKNAVELIKVKYEDLEVISSPTDGLKANAPLLHENMDEYTHIDAVHPEPGSNVANHTKIRKGEAAQAIADAEIVIEDTFSFPPCDHVAMETRAVISEIKANGNVVIHSTTQAPFTVKELLSFNFDIPVGKIKIIAPPIGGGFGGKAGIQLEGLGYLLTKAADGRPVKLVNDREEDMLSSPGHIGMEAKVRLGATADGKLIAAELDYHFDAGAYADYAVNVSNAAAISCTGPYDIPNVRCDSLCVYTNHPFATAFRGFGHVELAFPIERSMDLLAEKAGIDPVEIRMKNAIKEGDTSPTQSLMDANTGDLRECIKRAAKMINWDQGSFIKKDENKVIAKGFGLLWKSPAMPPNTGAGAIITFNKDGSLNLHTGIMEIGQGSKTGLAQIVAERFGTSPENIHLVQEVNTETAPHDWSTAASRSLMMAGRAALEAADDAIDQICRTAAIPLRCPPEDLIVEGGRVFLEDEPSIGLPLDDVVHGYVYENGNAIEGQVIGRGNYIARRLSGIDPETGKGRPSLEYTLGAQAVEIELDLNDYSYQIKKAVSCMDVGKVINPNLARGQVVGAISMGIGLARSEGFVFNSREQVVNGVLRDYKVLRYGEEPEYEIDFVETPQGDGPFGLRGLGEQGIIGIPGAIANALSRATGVKLNYIPLLPEDIWQSVKEASHNDSI